MKTIPQLILSFVILCLVGVAPTIQAVVPPPDGGYPGFTTAEGTNALLNLTTGAANTGLGWSSLLNVTTGSFNTGVGGGTLALNTGDSNTAAGAAALLLNTTGIENTAVGTAALVYNDTGDGNTATGAFALNKNTTGDGNIAVGYNALPNNTTGTQNIAVGYSAMRDNTVGSLNTAVGLLSLISNTEGGNNTAIGRNALQNNETGSANTAIGYRAGLSVTGDNNVCIGGATGVAGVDETTWIANVNTLTQNFSAGVNDYVTVRLSDGRLGHTAVVSSQRYKHDIKPLAAASKVLYELNPVSFRLKKEYDATQALGFGLIAEEVEKLNGDLVYRNDKGQVESVRYEMINAMLLNEFLKEHRRGEEQDCKIQEQETTIAELRSEIRNLAVKVNEQASQLQKVSAWIETSEAKPQFAQDR